VIVRYRNIAIECSVFGGSGMAQWLYVAVTQVPERRFEFSEG